MGVVTVATSLLFASYLVSANITFLPASDMAVITIKSPPYNILSEKSKVFHKCVKIKKRLRMIQTAHIATLVVNTHVHPAQSAQQNIYPLISTKYMLLQYSSRDLHLTMLLWWIKHHIIQGSVQILFNEYIISADQKPSSGIEQLGVPVAVNMYACPFPGCDIKTKRWYRTPWLWQTVLQWSMFCQMQCCAVNNRSLFSKIVTTDPNIDHEMTRYRMSFMHSICDWYFSSVTLMWNMTLYWTACTFTRKQTWCKQTAK